MPLRHNAPQSLHHSNDWEIDLGDVVMLLSRADKIPAYLEIIFMLFFLWEFVLTWKVCKWSYNHYNQSPSGNIRFPSILQWQCWSRQLSGSKGDDVLKNTGEICASIRLSVCLSIHPSVLLSHIQIHGKSRQALIHTDVAKNVWGSIYSLKC